MKKSSRWHCFGNCGGWDEWHIFASTKRIALSHAIKYGKIYGHFYLEDQKKKVFWGIECVNGKFRLMQSRGGKYAKAL